MKYSFKSLKQKAKELSIPPNAIELKMWLLT